MWCWEGFADRSHKGDGGVWGVHGEEGDVRVESGEGVRGRWLQSQAVHELFQLRNVVLGWYEP